MSTLKELGVKCDARIGVATTMSGLLYAPPAYQQFITENCSLLSNASGLQWGVCHPEQDTYNFVDADWVLAYTQKNGMLLRGHSLCWNSDHPAWLTNVLSSSNAQDILVSHITTVAGRYAGKLDSWDVVNEPITVWQDQPNGLSSGPWYTALGPEYMDLAFSTVAAVDPTAVRVLNLHECEAKNQSSTRAASLALVEALLKRGVPLQAIGLESHLDIGNPIDYAALGDFIRAFKSLGLKVEITELDINDARQNGSFAERDTAVSNWYQIYLDFILGLGIVERIVFWSPADTGNWMDPLCEAGDPEYIRDDGACDHRPGLLNTEWELAPAYYGICAALESRSVAFSPHGDSAVNFTSGRN